MRVGAGVALETGDSGPADPLIAVFGDVVIIGGGCYGTFYARQLHQAREKQRADYRRILIVDRNSDCQAARELGDGESRTLVTADWGDFLDDYLGRGERVQTGGEDAIVPSPFMPHLMFEWLLRRARWRWPGRQIESRSLPEGPGTPYDRVAPDGTRYVSFADWLCPTHCIEPAVCPVIRGPRTWEMEEAFIRLTDRLGRVYPIRGPVLFQCRHQVFGVGTFGARSVLDGDAAVAAAGSGGGEVDVVVATISSCHGAAGLLHLGPA
jgi:hypothetical protein